MLTKNMTIIKMKIKYFIKSAKSFIKSALLHVFLATLCSIAILLMVKYDIHRYIDDLFYKITDNANCLGD